MCSVVLKKCTSFSVLDTVLSTLYFDFSANGMEYVSAEYEWSITDHSYAMGKRRVFICYKNI